VFCSWGHRFRAVSTDMFACPARSGSLNASNVVPDAFAFASSAEVTEPLPQIIGTNSVPDGAVMPCVPEAQV
jgi:hypothetical protein